MLTLALRLAILATAIATTTLLIDPLFVDAATPEPSMPSGGDPRSSGEGRGFAGEPGAAILTVLVIGAASALLTYLYVLATRRSPSR